jgi:hypothetical protein
MRYSKQRVPIRTRHIITQQEYICDEVQALVGVGTGLAIAPITPDKCPGATFASCDHWILTHLESGLYVGEPFPAHEAFAKTYLEAANQIDELHLTRAALEADRTKRHVLRRNLARIRQQVEQRFLYRQEALF